MTEDGIFLNTSAAEGYLHIEVHDANVGVFGFGFLVAQVVGSVG